MVRAVFREIAFWSVQGGPSEAFVKRLIDLICHFASLCEDQCGGIENPSDSLVVLYFCQKHAT